MLIQMVKADDWAMLFCDQKLVFANHSIPNFELFDLIRKHHDRLLDEVMNVEWYDLDPPDEFWWDCWAVDIHYLPWQYMTQRLSTCIEASDADLEDDRDREFAPVV